MEPKKSQKLFQEAQKVIPGGVNSPVRAFRAVGLEPLFVSRAQGAKVYDADGRAYLDFMGSWGPMILGHAHPKVRKAMAQALRKGWSYGAATELEVRLAQKISKAIPSMEMLRMVSSGTGLTQPRQIPDRAASGEQNHQGKQQGDRDNAITLDPPVGQG